MFKENVVNGYRNRISEIINLIDSIPENRLGAQSSLCKPETSCHPIWTLGHLASSAQAISEEMSVAHWLPKSWDDLYGQNSEPKSDLSIYKSKEELNEILNSSVETVCKSIDKLTVEDLRGPMPDKRYRHIFPSLAHVISEILIKHTSEHVKMLLLWEIYLEK